ncbi:MAG: hypothetical protein NTX59_03060 [Elusimicrobia bacterium]|nr:hypothetical protein [Elusimicrobiota bacterium]
MKKMILPILIRLIAYPAALYLVFSVIVFFLYTHPKRYISPPGLGPGNNGPAVENVRLATPDGVELDGWYIPNKKSGKALIICHGYPMDKGNVLSFTSFLAKDFNLLLFDFRAMGKSGGFFSTGGRRETRDVSAAVNFLKAKGFTHIGAFGFSMGAATLAMAKDYEIKARVLDSPYASLSRELDFIFKDFGVFRIPLLWLMKAWNLVFLGISADGVAPENFIAAIKTPVLLIHGDSDTQVPVENSLTLHTITPKTELWIIKGANHGETSFIGGAQYNSRILNFFNKNL